jgi:hypothetical protein
MTTKYNIGTLNEAELRKLGFSVVDNDITIQNCIARVKLADQNKPVNEINKYIAIPNNPTGTGLNMQGICYKGINYNPIVNPDSTDGILFDIYGIPDTCTTVENCLKGNSNAILRRELDDITALIKANEKEKEDVNIRLIAIANNKTYGDAAAQYNRDVETARLTAELTKLRDKLTILLSYKASLLARNSESSILLSDKNRLLATVNSNIQQKYTKLSDVNNKINTITQDIYTNDLETKRKENIISTLKVIILIIILMAVILIIYLGMQFTEQNYPDIYNKVGKLNTSIFY